MTDMGRTVYLFDLLLTILGFLGAFWIRRFILPEAEIDFYSHVFLIPLLLFFIVGLSMSVWVALQ